MLPSYMGIIIHHCKDPYEPTSMMESKKESFFHGSSETGDDFRQPIPGGLKMAVFH